MSGGRGTPSGHFDLQRVIIIERNSTECGGPEKFASRQCIDKVSIEPMRIGIEVDHSVPRYKSIRKLNYFRGETSIIVLKGKAAGKQHKVDESGKRCKGLKTPSVVPDLTDKVIMLSTPDFSVA